MRAAPESEYIAIGERCVEEIERLLDAEAGLIWNFVDLDPAELRDLEAAVFMGLRVTAAGEIAATAPLIRAQVERARNQLSDYGSGAEMSFVVSEISPSTVLGRVEELVSYKCLFENPERLVVFEDYSVVLS